MEAYSLDHVIVGVADLRGGMAAFEELAGVAPIYGGAHAGIGTRNALVSLGSDVYLELLAPDPDSTPDQSNALAGIVTVLAEMHDLTPMQWTASSDDLAATAERVAQLGLTLSASVPNSRVTPDGLLVSWEGAVFSSGMSGELPFFIHSESAEMSPARSSPAGCDLTRLTVSTADPATTRKLVDGLKLPVHVQQGSETRLTLDLSCPKGRVSLGA